MKYWFAFLYNAWQLARASLLYVPAIFCLGFMVVTIGVFQLDLHFTDAFSDRRLIYGGTIDEAKDILGLLLGSMITMTTLVISITMVVLSLSASQLGPRLVRIFMSDRRTQIYFGIFFGTIALCFTCLGILHDPASLGDTPRATMSFTFLMCFSNLFILLAYVNHVAQSGIADNIIARLATELQESIDRLASKDGGEAIRINESGEGYFPDAQSHKKEALLSPAKGYIQSIQYQSLYKFAEQCDAFIQLRCKPGDYVAKGQEIGFIYSATDECSAEQVLNKVQGALLLGESRSATQDIEYSIRHMVEIALRALSPGINDCYTAITVLDKLTGVLAHLFTLSLPRYAFKNEKGQLRLLGASCSEADIIFKALAEIRHAGQGQLIILENLITNIAILKSLAHNQAEQNALNLQLTYIMQHINQHFANTPTETILNNLLSEKGLTAKIKNDASHT